MSVEFDEKRAKELVLLFVNGETSAFSALYDLSIKMVYRTTALLLKNSVDTSDVVQDIYIQLFHSLSNYDVTRSFKLWLLGVVYKQVSAYRRKVWLSIRLVEKLNTNHQVQPKLHDQNQLDYVEREQIEQLLNQLSYKHRQVIILKYFNDLSQEAIAQLLDVPVGTVKSRLNSALRKLRGEYREFMQLTGLKEVK